MHHWVIVESVDVALRAVGVTPVGAFQELPPLAPVLQIDRTLRRREHQRARVKHVRQRVGIVLRVRRNFGEGCVTGGFDEILELPVGHRRAVDPEAVDTDAMRRRFLRIMPVRAHAKGAAINAHHSLDRRSVGNRGQYLGQIRHCPFSGCDGAAIRHGISPRAANLTMQNRQKWVHDPAVAFEGTTERGYMGDPKAGRPPAARHIGAQKGPVAQLDRAPDF